ncbi:flavoprotein oxygenase [Trichoderma gamsii]|uniref:Flavoprotein oxygenase n=1 Tax=Trichoderma gamsii TaxID=398673 RepID=A0A2P4ZLR7_9HYPO|nr:flavoprotein oxygenase [Trichoderma gamsii]PON25234.1 flavoprotein oxygenase [Trichoderma gamsii]
MSAESRPTEAVNGPKTQKSDLASRPPWDETASTFVQNPEPGWTFGSGANHTHARASASAATAKHVAIDPFAPDRKAMDNYRLLVSGVVPRPIALISTRSPDGTVENLAPMSFFQMVNIDPPILAVGLTSSLKEAKDTLLNLIQARECVVNVVSEGFIEAVNATSINTPYGVSEWDIAGLTPVYDCHTVSCARVKESIFSIEARLESVREFTSRSHPGKKSGCLVLLEVSYFWAREDAINEDKNHLDLTVLRPMSRLGGNMYGRTTQVMELKRPDFETDLNGFGGLEKLKEAKEKQ